MISRKNKIITFLTSPTLCFYTLPWFMILIIVGTISQQYIGLWESQKMFFQSWFFWAGFVPLPGLATILALISLGIISMLVFKIRWNSNNIGNIGLHIGVLIFLFGGLMAQIYAKEGNLVLLENGQQEFVVKDDSGKEVFTLPFGVTLEHFQDSYYSGTSIAKSYSSEVTIHDKELKWPAKIEMNHPLRYAGYNLYQQSFVNGKNSRTSVLSVVWNPDAFFPYIAAAVMSAGLIIHSIIQVRRRKRAI